MYTYTVQDRSRKAQLLTVMYVPVSKSTNTRHSSTPDKVRKKNMLLE